MRTAPRETLNLRRYDWLFLIQSLQCISLTIGITYACACNFNVHVVVLNIFNYDCNRGRRLTTMAMIVTLRNIV